MLCVGEAQMDEIERDVARKIDLLLYEEALELIRSTPLTHESGTSIYPYEGRVLYLQRRYDESIALLEGLARRFPPNIKAKRFLYEGLLAKGDFASSFRVAKECWAAGDYRRSTLIRVLAHGLVLRELDFVDLLDAHCDEPLLLSLACVYSGRLERAVKLMRDVDGCEDSKAFLDALIAVQTGSVYMLDYVRYLDEDVLVAAIGRLEAKQRVFAGARRQGCRYADSKTLRIARRVLCEDEYKAVAESFLSSGDTSHSCTKDCLVEELRARTLPMALPNEDDAGRPMGRYSELQSAFSELRADCDKGMEALMKIYGQKTAPGLESYLEDAQNTVVLEAIAKSYLEAGREADASRSSRLLASARSSCVRDTIECLSVLMDDGMVREIVEILELDVFSRDGW